MAHRSQREDWPQRVSDLLDAQAERVHSQEMLRHLLAGPFRRELGIPKSMSFKRMAQVLLEETELQEIRLRREGQPSSSGPVRYIWRDASPYAIGQSLARGSYLSHASAMFLHALTDQVPKTIYVNREQSLKPDRRGELSQAGIDRAFRRAPRVSRYIFVSPSARFVLLSGKNTGRLEVSEVRTPEGELVNTTKLERTLIDITVRPAYAGGIFEVRRAYDAALGQVSVNKLVAVLRQLDHLYPYHQSIGFLMEREGFGEEDLSKLEALGVNWDFYLDYQMKDPQYDERWRLYYPQGL